jgi:hypothetical protein
MAITYHEHGEIVEIVETEKSPSKVRVYSTRVKPLAHPPRRLDNIRYSKKLCLWRVSAGLRAFGCPLLITCTFEGDASDAAFANDAIRDFQVRLRGEFPRAESIFVPELSPRGRIHAHGLLFNVPLPLGDTRDGRRIVAYGEEREKRILQKLWREGFVDATKTDGSLGLAYYLSKYITKGAGQTIFNAMRILRVSRGIPRGITERGEVAEEYAKRYADKKPIKEWSGYEIFHGAITKKTYKLQE